MIYLFIYSLANVKLKMVIQHKIFTFIVLIVLCLLAQAYDAYVVVDQHKKTKDQIDLLID